MKTLADELLILLPGIIASHPEGATIEEAARRLVSPRAFVREAFDALDSEGRAILVRRRNSHTLYLVPIGYPISACKNCHAEFERPKGSRRLCCSRSCGISWSWRLPGVREKRMAGIRVERATPKARERLAAHNRRRWAKPGEHEKLAEQNRTEWADPVKKARRSAKIQAAQGKPEAREMYRNIRLKDWSDPAYREKMKTAVRWRKVYLFQGEMMCLTELAEATGINRETLCDRLKHQGLSVEEAVRRGSRRFREAA